MAFASMSEFWAMGGYGFFVWLSFGSGLALMAGLWVHGMWQRRQLRHQVCTEQRRRERIKRYRQQQEKTE